MKFWLSLAVATMALVGCDRVPQSPAAPPSAPAAAAPADDKLQAALQLKHTGKLAEARTALLNLPATAQIVAQLNDIDTQILFTATPAPEKIDYAVQPGDSLDKIAKKFGTTVQLIKKSNNLSRDMIRAGDRLRVYQGKFAVEVNKASNTLLVTDSGKFFKCYRVGTGQFSKTPVGEFRITTRIESPPWYRGDGKAIPYGDPENILGTHWLGINVAGYGIHGTWDTNSIGHQASAGCVRLLNDDIAELYTMLPVGTSVTIHD